jgi:hypothetical protein
MIESPSHISIGLEVKDPITPGHCVRENFGVQNVAFNERKPRPIGETIEEFPAPGTKIIHDNHLGLRPKKGVGEIATNKASAPGDARSPRHHLRDTA